MPDEWRVDLFVDVIFKCPNLDFLLVTKRVPKAREFMEWHFNSDRPFQNVWFIATTENQARFDERVPELLKIPAVVHGVSYEPALGPIDFAPWLTRNRWAQVQMGAPLTVPVSAAPGVRGLDWIIVGGESNQGERKARPFDLAWARSAIAQGRTAKAAVFVKQLGANVIDTTGTPTHWTPNAPPMPDRIQRHTFTGKGHDPAEWPEDLRVQEWPR